MRKTTTLATLGLIVAAVLTGVSLGQDGDGDRDRDGDRGRDRGRYGRRNFDPKEILKRIDDNGNGVIEPNEMSDRSRGFLQRAAEKAGLDMQQPLPIDKLGQAFDQIRAEEGGGSPGGTSSSSSSNGTSDNSSSNSGTSSSNSPASSSSTPKEAPKVPGFGVAEAMAKPPGFDVPPGEDTANLEKRFDARILEYVNRMLSEQDKNNDGYIDSEEWKTGRWSTPPEASDTNKDGRLSKLELCVRIANRFGSRERDQDRGRDGDRRRDDDRNRSGSSSNSGSTSSSSSSSSGDKYRSYAEALLKQYDKNKSGYLERDEIAEMKSDYRSADANNDGTITVDELTAKLQSYSGGSSSSSRSTNSTSSSSSAGKSDSTTVTVRRNQWWKSKDPKEEAAKQAGKKSYRFQSPTERLPKGLPDWFLRNDADADGQLMMAEYAASWTESAAADFLKYDVDGDGFISPEECLAVEQAKKR